MADRIWHNGQHEPDTFNGIPLWHYMPDLAVAPSYVEDDERVQVITTLGRAVGDG